jgi:hypothetical protein
MDQDIEWVITILTRGFWMLAFFAMLYVVVLVITHFLPDAPAEPEQADEQPEAIN